MENSDHLNETQRAALTELRRYCNVVMKSALEHVEAVAESSGSNHLRSVAHSTCRLVGEMASTANALLLRDESEHGNGEPL